MARTKLSPMPHWRDDIDYTFVSRPEAIEAVTVGSNADWIVHSDHSPMTVDLRL